MGDLDELIERLRDRAARVDPCSIDGDFYYPTLANVLRAGLADELRQAADALSRYRWVPVSERLPPRGLAVVARLSGPNRWWRTGGPSVFLTMRGEPDEDGAEWWNEYGYDRGPPSVTHWMPLPPESD
jgi:hypothetical protein